MSQDRRRLNPRLTGLRRPGFVSLMVFVLLVLTMPFVVLGRSNAVQLSFRKLALSDGTTSLSGVKYNFSFNTNTSGPIGSVMFEVCTNYQYEPGDPCTAPAGFDASAAALTAQTGITDFSINGVSDANTIILSRPGSVSELPQPLTMEFSGVTNPSTIGSDYVRITTYATTDGSGPETDFGIVVFAINESITISTEVPPYLQFCTGVTISGFNCGTAEGSFLSFGELSRSSARSATSQMLASTNAPYGYSVTMAGTTMTAGINTIPAMNGGTSIPGTGQFGINSRQNSTPGVGSDPAGPGFTVPGSGYNTPNQYRFQSGDIIASSANTDDFRKLTVSYIVNVGPNQAPGRYVATISYICLANF